MKLYLPSCFSFTLWLLILHYIFVKRLLNSGFTISRAASFKCVFFPVFYCLFAEQTPSVSPSPAWQRCSSGRHQRQKRLPNVALAALAFHSTLNLFQNMPKWFPHLSASEISKWTITGTNQKLTGPFPNTSVFHPYFLKKITISFSSVWLEKNHCFE